MAHIGQVIESAEMRRALIDRMEEKVYRYNEIQ